MSSPVRSVAVRLSLDPSSYIAGATKAERSTLALDRAVSKVGPNAGTSMEKAAAGAGKAEGALGRLNRASGALGFTLGGLAGVGAAVAGAMSVKWAGDYQAALTKLATTAGESQKNLGMVGKGMLDMAGQVGIGADQLAKGMYTIDSAGIHGADSLIVLKAAAQGARQEQADLGHVVDAVTTSLHDYHLPASDAAKVTSQLIAAVSNGKTTFDELTGAMHSVEPIAASAGMSIAQTAGALAAMTASGMHADQAAQNLASSIRSFEKPTGTMRDELYQLGIDAQDLSAHLGDRGIAGTLQLVSDAIVSKMGPAGKVALDALNKNKAAAQDLVIMMKAMPPALATASAGLLDGSLSVSAYTKAARGLGGEQAAMALQFLGLYKSSAGFSNILKTGGPAVQTYIGALGKAVGTSEGLSVALQLTGENAAGANKAIAAVGKAAASTSGDIHGWDEVQRNFNQRLSEAEAGAKSLAIEAGQHLLPVLTSAFGYVNREVIPGVEHLGSAVGDAGHAFMGLPDPIREVALTLGGLALANHIGLTGVFAGAMTRLGTTFTSTGGMVRGLGDQMAVQQRLSQMNAVAISEVDRALGGLTSGLAAAGTELTAVQRMLFGYDAALAETTVAEDAAAAGAGRLSTGLSTVALRGGQAATRGIGAFTSALGGPWGVAIGAAILTLPTLANGFELLTGHVIDATSAQQSFTSALQASNGVIDDSVRKNVQQQLTQAGVIDSFKKAGISAQDAVAGIMGNAAAQDRVTKALQDYITHSISVEGHNNKNAQTAAKARDAYDQLTGAFGHGQQSADYFANSAANATKKTDQTKTSVDKLGHSIRTLPNGKVVVSADTGPAKAELNRLIKIYQGTTLTLAGNYHVAGLNGQPGGTQTKATGGPIIGPGTGTSDSVLIAASNGEHMWTAAETAAAGGHAGVAALRRAVLAGGGGRAAGGPIGHFDMYDTVPAHLSASAIRQAEASIRSLAAAATFTGGGGGAGSAAIRALGQSIAASMGYGSQFGAIDYVFSHESGWNPHAQNPTSTAYGIPQFLDSTWGPYGGKTSDAGQQIRDGIAYMRDRYGSPNGAASFWAAHHWYEKGTDYVGATGLAGLHQGEAVLTRSDNAALRSIAMRTREMVGVGGGQTIVHKTDARSYPVTVTTSPSEAQIVRSLQDAQYQQEFLHG